MPQSLFKKVASLRSQTLFRKVTMAWLLSGEFYEILGTSF